MQELNSRDREILLLATQGWSDLDICRKFGLLIPELEETFERIRELASNSPDANGTACSYERALRRRAENRAHSLERRYLALMESSPEAVLVVKAGTGEIRHANGNAARLFGYEPADLIGLSVEQLVPERWRAVHPAYRIGFLSSVRKREMGYHPPIYARRADGSEFEVAVALTATSADDEVMVVCSEFLVRAQNRVVQDERANH